MFDIFKSKLLTKLFMLFYCLFTFIAPRDNVMIRNFRLLRWQQSCSFSFQAKLILKYPFDLASYQYQGWEYTGMDQDEEEEDFAADEEIEEDDDEDPNKKKPFGETAHFCPVMLRDESVLWPGSPDCAVKYRERVYFLSSHERREAFLEDPEIYLPQKKPLEVRSRGLSWNKNISKKVSLEHSSLVKIPSLPSISQEILFSFNVQFFFFNNHFYCFKIPPVRLLLLGPKGSGKTLHGRLLAKKFGILHISFKDRLQELILHKTLKKVGPDFEFEDENEEEDDEDDEDQEGLVTFSNSELLYWWLEII